MGETAAAGAEKGMHTQPASLPVLSPGKPSLRPAGQELGDAGGTHSALCGTERSRGMASNGHESKETRPPTPVHFICFSPSYFFH